MHRERKWIEPAPFSGVPVHSSGSPLLDSLLLRRGVTTAAQVKDWLDTSIRPAPDPSLIPNLDRAIDRLYIAIAKGERIAIHGDYDVDGLTSTAMLVSALRSAVRHPELVTYHVPERGDGYGLSPAAVEHFAGLGVSLIIAVDCGTNDVEALEAAKTRGIDVVVLDHHKITREIGADEIIANPQLSEDGVGHELTGAGVVYTAISALAREGVQVAPDGQDERSHVDLAMLGTIADVGSLTGLNRAIARDGLRRMRLSPRPGLRALADIARVSFSELEAKDIPFKFTPRLNAPGRLESPQLTLDLLLTDDPTEAKQLARRIEEINIRRKTLTDDLLDKVVEEADVRVAAGDPVVIVRGSDWTTGLLGLAAGKLAERYGRPAVVLADHGNGCAGGSGRSIPGFDLTAALLGRSDLLQRFGGHGQAAGLTIAIDRLEELRSVLCEALLMSGLQVPAPIEHVIDADFEPQQVTVDAFKTMQQMAPFGTGNPEPVIRLRKVKPLAVSRMGGDSSHLRLQIDRGGRGGSPIKAVFFGGGERQVECPAGKPIDLLGTIQLNVWNGYTTAELHLVDFRPAQ